MTITATNPQFVIDSIGLITRPTLNYTLPINAQFLYVAQYFDGPPNVTDVGTVEFDATALTLSTDNDDGLSGGRVVSLHKLDVTALGAVTGGIIATNPTTKKGWIFAFCVEAPGTITEGTPVTPQSNGSAASVSANIPSQVGDFVIGVFCVDDGEGTNTVANTTLTTSQTEIVAQGDITIGVSGVYSLVGLASTTTMTWGFNTSDDNGVIGVSLTEAAVVAPVLSSPTGTATGQTTATGTVVSDTAAGTIWAYVSQSASPPSVPDNKSGAGSDAFDTEAPPIVGVNNFSFIGLVAGRTYFVHYLQNDGVVDSTQVTSTSFTTTSSLTPDLTSDLTSDLTN